MTKTKGAEGHIIFGVAAARIRGRGHCEKFRKLMPRRAVVGVVDQLHPFFKKPLRLRLRQWVLCEQLHS